MVTQPVAQGGLRVALVASAAMGGGYAADGEKESKNSHAPRRRLDDERPYREPDEQADEEEQRLSVRTLLDAALVPVVGTTEDVVRHAYSSGLLGAYFSTSAFRCFG